MKHILVVDDDGRLRELLKKYLLKQGFQVTTSPQAQAASHLMSSFDFDLLIVDVMMPGEDGVSFVRRLRESSNVPVIMLTAKSEIEDKIFGFEAGIDDFVTKPFEPRELVMRIDTILRRARPIAENNTDRYFGDFKFESTSQKLTKSGERVELTRNERGMLQALLTNIGETLSRDELLLALGDQSNLRNVDVTVTRLRKKIEKDPKNPLYIHTVRGKGYKFSAPLEIQSNPPK